MTFILYKSDNVLPGVRIIGNTSTHNFGTGELDDSLISRIDNNVWFTEITQSEAEAVIWLWKTRGYIKIIDLDVDPSSSHDETGGTGKIRVDETEEITLNAVSLGKKIKKKITADLFTKEFNKISYGESDQDKILWNAQLIEANRYINDNSVDTPILTVLSNNRDISVSELANNVISASNKYNMKIAELLNNQQVITDTINQATTILELDAIDPEGLRTDL